MEAESMEETMEEILEIEVELPAASMTEEEASKLEITLFIENLILEHKKARSGIEMKVIAVQKEIERLKRENAEQARQLQTGLTPLDKTVLPSENIQRITKLISEFHKSHGWLDRPPLVNEVCNAAGDLLATYAKCLECERRIQIQGLKINAVATLGPDISYYKMHVNGIHFPAVKEEASQPLANPEEQAVALLTGTQSQLETDIGTSENNYLVSEMIRNFHKTHGWLDRPLLIDEAFNMDGELQETFVICPECEAKIKVQGLKINGVATAGPDISYYKMHVNGSHFPEVKEDGGLLLEI